MNVKHVIVGGCGVIALLFACDVCFDPAESNSPMDLPRPPLSAIDWPNVRTNPMPIERWTAREMAPAERIQQAFSVVVPGESRRVIRYSWFATTSIE
jgi:hypothetical protein